MSAETGREIERILRERLGAIVVECEDRSAAHAGHAEAGAGGHYQIVLVAHGFTGRPPVERHRMVYDALADLMPGRIHALAIRAYAPDELRDEAAPAGTG